MHYIYYKASVRPDATIRTWYAFQSISLPVTQEAPPQFLSIGKMNLHGCHAMCSKPVHEVRLYRPSRAALACTNRATALTAWRINATMDHDGGDQTLMSPTCSKATREPTRRVILDSMRVLLVGVSALAFVEISSKNAEAKADTTEADDTGAGFEADTKAGDEGYTGDEPPQEGCKPPGGC